MSTSKMDIPHGRPYPRQVFIRDVISYVGSHPGWSRPRWRLHGNAIPRLCFGVSMSTLCLARTVYPEHECLTMVPSKEFVSSMRLVMSAFTCWPKAAGWSDLGKRLMNSCSQTAYSEGKKHAAKIRRGKGNGSSHKKFLRNRQPPNEPKEFPHRYHWGGICFVSTVAAQTVIVRNFAHTHLASANQSMIPFRKCLIEPDSKVDSQDTVDAYAVSVR